MRFETYPKDGKVWIEVDPASVIVVERALSGMTWLLHLPGWAAAVPVYDPDKLLQGLVMADDQFVEISPGRWVRAPALAAAFYPTQRRDVIRIQFDRIRQHFDVFPNEETGLADQWGELLLMFEAAGATSRLRPRWRPRRS